MAVIDYFRTPLALITLTFLVYWGASWLRRRTGLALLNPMIVTIGLLIVFLRLTGISFGEYYEGGKMIEFWLKPAIVALGLPLFYELKNIRRQFMPLFLTEVAGSLTGIISVVLIAKLLGATPDVIRSLAPKSVSTPIAIEITAQLGGIPALTSAIVVIVGMIGAVMGLKVMEMGNVKSPVSKSLSMGTAAHVIGTNRISEYGARYGAYSTLGLILNGILTAFFAGPVLDLLL
ncbi:MAG: LrgB family protein [Paramuribaculum sp.]|nr:LrgB family protein [Paramuribaculum sp.]MDE6488550.1 LrgB family protein [Paramuribaculum sp.]